MFGRRPLRRLVRQRLGVGLLEARVIQMLRQAHRLMEGGQYGQAFPIFKRLADGAAERGMPVKAAHMYLQAAHARLEMGDANDALDLARRSVQLLANAGQAWQLRALLPRLVQAFEEKGYRDQAVILRAEAEALLGGERPAPPPAQRGTLPSKCPSCGGPVRADEVEWIDDRSAECAYCGSVIQAQS